MKLVLILTGGLACMLWLSGVKAKLWPLCFLAQVAGYLLVWFGADLLLALIDWMLC